MLGIHTRRLASVVLIVTMFTGMVPSSAAPTGPLRELAPTENSRPVSDDLDPSTQQVSVQAPVGGRGQVRSTSAQVGVVVPADSLQVGGTFTVTVAVAQVDAPLSAFQFDLSFDPTILAFLRASAGPFLGSTGRAVVCPAVAQEEGVASLTVRLACASTGDAPGVIAPGDLAILTFTALSEGRSGLTLSAIQLPTDARPPALITDITAQDATITIGAVKNWLYLPIVLRNFGGVRATLLPDAFSPAHRGAPLPAVFAAAVPAALYAPLLRTGSGHWADLDGDRDVDEADLVHIAGYWNCALGDACYVAAYDFSDDEVIDVQDLAWVGNEYDVAPPELVITSPAEGAAVGGTTVNVTGRVTDTHAVTATVNGVTAALVGQEFSASIPVTAGNQVLQVLAMDALGQFNTASRVVGVDSEGPWVEIHAPRHRQSVYTLDPSVAISYTDYYAAVDVGTFHAELNGVDVTGDLMAGPDGATGTLNVTEDTVYTLTVTIEDSFGNTGGAQSVFYVPPDPGSIAPPDEPEDAGWVSGVIYDSSICDEHLTECPRVAGARVTLEQVDGGALRSVRAARQEEIAARLASADKFVPLSPQIATTFTVPISGTVVTGPDGFFAFPVAQTGHYWLRVEKEGYSYGQREAEIVKERSAATNAIYLTPLDPAETACDEGGCAHTSSDGTVEVDIPPGAIPTGEVVSTTATNFEHVEFLPSGELPQGTWETYAFNLGGDSGYEFEEPVTVRIQNYRGFSPGTEIPLGYWNDETMAWEHAGTAIVDASGQWVEMEVFHFSNYDANGPVSKGDVGGKGDGDGDGPPCGAKDEGGSIIMLKSGHFREEIALPPVHVLDEEVAPRLLYNSNRANSSHMIDIKLSVNPDQGVELGDYIGFELYIEGQKTDSFAISNTIQSGEVGRYRYLWDGRDAQGNLLPSGVYAYRAKLSIPYRAQYCLAIGRVFGNPPDCETGPTGVYVDATEDVWVEGTVELNTQVDYPLGTGWVLDGVQRLYEDEAGHILIVDGDWMTEFYAAGKDLLTEYYSSGGETAAATSEVRRLSRSEIAPRGLRPHFAWIDPRSGPGRQPEVTEDTFSAELPSLTSAQLPGRRFDRSVFRSLGTARQGPTDVHAESVFAGPESPRHRGHLQPSQGLVHLNVHLPPTPVPDSDQVPLRSIL